MGDSNCKDDKSLSIAVASSSVVACDSDAEYSRMFTVSPSKIPVNHHVSSYLKDSLPQKKP